jgi:hypothetical protein
MNVKIGDKILMKNTDGTIGSTEWLVLGLKKKSITVKHPNMGGEFTFLRSYVAEVING